MRGAVPKRNPNRIEKVNSLIQHLMGSILLPYFKSGQLGIVTVSKVETSRDMRWAKIWISVVGGENGSNDETVLNTLQNNLYDIQGELNREMEVKIVPRISFHLDTSGRYAAKINELFKKIEQEHEGQEHEDEQSDQR